MTKRRSSASVLDRLLRLAKQRGEDYSLLLSRFALERLLYRLSVSPHGERFLLKGALLFSLWYEQPHRPTRDADLLGFGDADQLPGIFRELAAMALDDAVDFEPASLRIEPIRDDSACGGMRVRLQARIGTARCALQVDVGFGDAVTPAPERVRFPALLPDFEAPRLRAYPVYSVIAEKYHAMVVLGLANSRMKDFYDVAVIAARTNLEGATLARAIAATFERRGTAMPPEPPTALRRAFALDAQKQRQWQAFLQRNRLAATELQHTVAVLHDLLWPPTQVAGAGSAATARWDAQRLAWSQR